MNKLFPNENEKNKEIKETSETESYNYYENEEMENSKEGFFLEEIAFSKDSLPSDISQILRSVSSSEKQAALEESLKDSEEKNELLLEKWFSVTGQKPKNIPTIRKYYDEAVDTVLFFGDRKSDKSERERARRLYLEAKRLNDLKITYGKIHREIQMPNSYRGVTSVKFAPNAHFFAHANLNGSVQIRLTSSGEVIMDLNTIERKENLAVNSLKYYPDGHKLFLGGQSGVIQVFNPESGKRLGVSNKLGVINALDIPPDGSALAVGGKGGALSVVDPLTLQVVWTRAWPNEMTLPKAEDVYHKMEINALRFHPTKTHTFVTGACDNSVKIWDVRTPKAIRSIRGPNIFGQGVDVMDDKIITASWRVENSLSLWNFPSGELIKNISVQSKVTKYEGEFLYCAKFFRNSPAFRLFEGNVIAVGGSGFNELLVINIETEKILAHFPSFKAIVAVDIRGNLIAYGGKESLFRIGEVESIKKIQRFPD